MNRVTLPDFTDRFMNNFPGCEKELENSSLAVKVFGEAGLPIVRQRFAGDTVPVLTTGYKAVQLGGALARGESLGLIKNKPEMPGLEERERFWSRFTEAFRTLVPLAEDYNVKLTVHPSNTPNHGILSAGWASIGLSMLFRVKTSDSYTASERAPKKAEALWSWMKSIIMGVKEKYVWCTFEM